MRLAWLGLGALAALSACAPYPGTYSYGTGYAYGSPPGSYDTGYAYASPPVADYGYSGGYYGSGYAAPYYGGGYATPYYAPPVVAGPTVVFGGGGDRHWDGDHWRGDDRARYDQYQRNRASVDRGRPAYTPPPQFQPREAPHPVAMARPAPSAPPPPSGGRAFENWSRRNVNAAPNPGDTGGR